MVVNDALYRCGLRALLESQPDLEIVGEAHDCCEAAECLRHLDVSVVLLDPRGLKPSPLGAIRAGWYTTLDPAIDFPYGVRHPEVDIAASATREHLVLMRGQLDTERDGILRDDPKADAQGRHRYARAGHAHAMALARDPQTNWRLLDVPGADHDQQLMAAAAQRFLLDADRVLPRTCPLPDGDPCP